jgi:hypothetical protein
MHSFRLCLISLGSYLVKLVVQRSSSCICLLMPFIVIIQMISVFELLEGVPITILTPPGVFALNYM